MSNHIEDNNHDDTSSLPRQQQQEEESLLHPHQTGVTIRNTRMQDIPKIVDLQKEYAQKVIRRELRDPVLSFELDNEFKFIERINPKILNGKY